MPAIVQQFANIWIGLANLTDLLFAWPADLLFSFGLTFGFLCILAIKRIFWG